MIARISYSAAVTLDRLKQSLASSHFSVTAASKKVSSVLRGLSYFQAPPWRWVWLWSGLYPDPPQALYLDQVRGLYPDPPQELFLDQAAKLEAISHKLQTPVADLEARLDSYMQDTDDLRKRLESLERTSLRAEAEQMLNQVQDVGGVKVVAGRSSATGPEGMREMGDFLKVRLTSAVLVLGAVVNGNPILVAMVTPDLVSRGLHAGNIARDTAKVMGGGGGGQAEMAQAGGRQADKLEEALRGVPELVATPSRPRAW